MKLEIIEQLTYMSVKSNIYQNPHKQKGIWFANFVGFCQRTRAYCLHSGVNSPVRVLM